MGVSTREARNDSQAIIGEAFCASGVVGGSESILLVEDEVFVRDVTAEVLHAAGYAVLTASDAADALETFRTRKRPIHLLLADVVMPGMSGPQVALQIEDLQPRLRVLLMTGYAEQIAACELSPCFRYCLAKPFTARAFEKSTRSTGFDPFQALKLLRRRSPMRGPKLCSKTKNALKSIYRSDI